MDLSSKWSNWPRRQEILIAAVADGAGSARMASVGARLAVTAIIDEITSVYVRLANGRITSNEIKTAVLMACNRVTEKAESRGHSSREYACTLICTVLEESRAWYFQIGDGAAVIRRGCVRGLIAIPAKGEYGNETFFVTDENLMNQIDIYEIPSPDEVTLFSDGIERIAIDLTSYTPHNRFFDSFYRTLADREGGFHRDLAKGLRRWMNSELVTSRTDDDKSMILISRRSTA